MPKHHSSRWLTRKHGSSRQKGKRFPISQRRRNIRVASVLDSQRTLREYPKTPTTAIDQPETIKTNSAMTLKSEFESIQLEVSRKFPKLAKVKLNHDTFMDHYHSHNPDTYAACNPDARKYEIIYAKALEKEPKSLQRGILWHEFGHQIQVHYLKEIPEDDLEANKIIEKNFRVLLRER